MRLNSVVQIKRYSDNRNLSVVEFKKIEVIIKRHDDIFNVLQHAREKCWKKKLREE